MGSFGVGAFTDQIRLSIYEVEDEQNQQARDSLSEGGLDAMTVTKARTHAKRNYVVWFKCERVTSDKAKEEKRSKHLS